MNYQKPEVILLASAVAAIQDPSNKQETDVLDSDQITRVSVNAYASDE